jgi:hypothetical protein
MDSENSSFTSNSPKRVNQVISNEVRKLIIDTINSGESDTVVAKTFKVKLITVKQFIRHF